MGIPLKELRASTRNDFFLTSDEIKVHKIVVDMAPYKPATAQSTSTFGFKAYTPRIAVHIYDPTASVFLDTS